MGEQVQSMLYLDGIILHNFKSFRHANIKFGKGFNCIVGPNGSGKSNICDSLLFALGESSLRRMRLTSFPQLINSRAKPKKEDNVKRAYVKLSFRGEEPLEIARVIKSNNKVGYRLNDRHATRQDVIDVLRAKHCEINETNAITQGEIGTLLSLNAKERRGLIDVAAGIKEFDDKKSTSLKELEKVEGSIGEASIMLNERQGFLNELEKEKEDAEHYLSLANTVKETNYTILKSREKSIMSEYGSSVALIKEREKKRNDIDGKIKETDLEIEGLSNKREEAAKSLNARSIEMGSTNSLLEAAKRDIAVKESQLGSARNSVSELEKAISELKSNRAKMLEERAANEEGLKVANEELDGKVKRLKLVDVYDDAGTGALLSRYGENQKKLDELEAEHGKAVNAHMQQSFAMESANARISELKVSIDGQLKERNTKMKSIDVERERLLPVASGIAEVQKKLEANKADIERVNDTINKIYIENVNLREQLASSGHWSDKSAETLGRSIKDGFYGRAYELCSYDDKFSTAVQAAAGQRLSYFVVDSSETASRAIKVLKEKSLGRASFIPIGDMQVRQTNTVKGLKPFIENVKFDKRYGAAFDYIFSNTYLVDSIEAAKKAGLGSCRFVTLEGELVEQSGVITGGTMRVTQSPALLESKLRKLDEEKKAASGRLSELNAEADALRKRITSYQTDEANRNNEIRHLQQQVDGINAAVESEKGELGSMESRLAEMKGEFERLKTDKEKVEAGISAMRAENEKLYSTKAVQQHKGRQQTAGGAQDAKALREEVEGLKIRIATAAKENEMRSGRVSELEKEMEVKAKEMDALKKSAAALGKEITELSRSKTELEDKIKSHDAKSAGLYKELHILEEKLTKMSTDKGRLSSDMEKTERDLIELSSRKSQAETRMNDIKAELLSYSGVDIIEGKTIEQLEAGLAVAKAELEKLGAVNLKAPEIYESKKSDVEMARQKIQILDGEKNSIVGMINEIESKKLNIFVETLKAVNENFKSLYGNIFDGAAYLYLENPKDPFNSGLLIHMTSATKKERASEQLSGGEKSLLMLMLIFAIQMRNPMSFYIFDEIDASLDKENSKKLSRLMKELSRSSQVIMVSHNDSMITAADTAIGVVRKNDESLAVGMQLNAGEVKNS